MSPFFPGSCNFQSNCLQVVCSIISKGWLIQNFLSMEQIWSKNFSVFFPTKIRFFYSVNLTVDNVNLTVQQLFITVSGMKTKKNGHFDISDDEKSSFIKSRRQPLKRLLFGCSPSFTIQRI